MVLLLILVPLMFASGAIFALGLVYFLKLPETPPRFEEKIAKIVQTQEPSLPTTSAPAPIAEKPSAAKVAPEKKTDSIELADALKEKKPLQPRPIIPPLEPAPPEKRPAEPPIKTEESKPPPKVVEKSEEKPPVKPPVLEKQPANEPTVTQKQPDTQRPVAEKPADKGPMPPATAAEQPTNGNLPADIQALIVKLRTGKIDQRIAAVATLAERGEAASGAAQAVCEAAMSPDKNLSRSALQALDKLAPQIQEPVFTLIVDGQAANHRKAIAVLRRLEGKAKPAMPVALFEVKKCLVDLEAQEQRRQGSIGWGESTLVEVIHDTLRCIPEIAPEAPDGLTAIILASRVTLKNIRTQNSIIVLDKVSGRRSFISRPFRSTAIPLLGTVAEKQPELRKVIVPQLSGLLDESMQQLYEHSTNLETKKNSFVIDRDLADIQSIGAALQGCGPDARSIVAKKLIPVLKDLEFSQNEKIRATAKQLRKQIEAAPKGGAFISPGMRLLAAEVPGNFLAPMAAHGTSLYAKLEADEMRARPLAAPSRGRFQLSDRE